MHTVNEWRKPLHALDLRETERQRDREGGGCPPHCWRPHSPGLRPMLSVSSIMPFCDVIQAPGSRCVTWPFWDAGLPENKEKTIWTKRCPGNRCASLPIGGPSALVLRLEVVCCKADGRRKHSPHTVKTRTDFARLMPIRELSWR